MLQKRAKQGGEVGPNGEFYEGGKFIATSDHAKRLGGRKSTGRVELERGIWVLGRAGWRPLYGQLAGIEAWNAKTTSFSFNTNLRLSYASPDVVVRRRAMIAAWNAGKRWIEVATYNLPQPLME